MTMTSKSWLPTGRSEKKLPRRENGIGTKSLNSSFSKYVTVPIKHTGTSELRSDCCAHRRSHAHERASAHARKLQRAQQWRRTETNTFKTHKLIIKILGCVHATACLPIKLRYLDPPVSFGATESKSARRWPRRCSPSVRIDRRDSNAASLHAYAGLVNRQPLLLWNGTWALIVWVFVSFPRLWSRLVNFLQGLQNSGPSE